MFPKVISEYTKKCDPDLPFYYYTGSNNRYNDGLIASFSVPSSTGEIAWIVFVYLEGLILEFLLLIVL